MNTLIFAFLLSYKSFSSLSVASLTTQPNMQWHILCTFNSGRTAVPAEISEIIFLKAPTYNKQQKLTIERKDEGKNSDKNNENRHYFLKKKKKVWCPCNFFHDAQRSHMWDHQTRSDDKMTRNDVSMTRVRKSTGTYDLRSTSSLPAGQGSHM